ncbi:MAG: NUDIX hydrolase [Clostridiales bacterium]|nr:NUDIX hydrolase [Clostridiales bacterium]
MSKMKYIRQIEEFQPSCAQEAADKAIVLDICARFGDILTRANLTCHITSSGLILNEGKDKMLMVHHNIYRTWTWTGGHADGEEDLEGIALREAAEETGVAAVELLLPDMASLDILPVFGHVKNGKYISAHLHLNASYLLQASEKEALAVRAGENTAVVWAPLAEVAGRSKEPELIRVFGKMLSRLDIALPL